MSEKDTRAVHSSAYHHQWEMGFSRLRFQTRIEEEFRFRSLRASLPQIRVALTLAILAVSALLVMDLILASSDFNRRAAPLRVGIVETVLIAILLLSFSERLRRFLPAACMFAGIVIGIAVLFVRMLEVEQGGPVAFSGSFLAIVYVYFLLGLRWLPAVITGTGLLLSFALFSWLTHMQTGAAVNTFMLLFASNAIGAWGLYDLEFNRRANFLKSRMLSYLVERDPLTGLPNRKAVDRLLRDAWSQCRTDEKSLVVALVDVDHFKAYNDTYGHQAGDRCLDQIAAALDCASRRPRDAVGRYGGEEFLIVLPEASEYYALVLLDSIRAQVEQLAMDHAGAPLGAVTVSVGVACCNPHSARFSRMEFVALADQALYKAKNQGRNRVVLGVRDAASVAPEHNFGGHVSVAVTE